MAHARADSGNNPPPKRRKLNGAAPDANPPAEPHESSSSDELAATSDYEMEERRRASWSARKATANRPKHNVKSHSPSGSDSPDELSMATDVLWGRKSPAKEEPPAHSEQEENNGEENQQEIEDTKVETEDLTPLQGETTNDSHSPDAPNADPPEKLPTPEPAPPPPPPKPDHVNYVQKHILKGHLRGVSAVKFSPDQTMLASGGTLTNMSLHLRHYKSIRILTGL